MKRITTKNKEHKEKDKEGNKGTRIADRRFRLAALLTSFLFVSFFVLFVSLW